MSEFLEILNNHRELLEERGYDEIGLGSPDQPGFFMSKLEYQFSECIRKTKYDDNKQDFFIDTYGFFNEDKDVIKFNFHYEFDPAEKNIDLKSLSASMDGIKRTFLVGPNMYHLIHANRLHKSLWHERERQVSGALIVLLPDIDKMIRVQDKYLEEMGYYNTMFPNPPNYIRDELRETLEQVLDQPTTDNQTIKISRYLHFHQYNSTKFSFQYQFDPVRNSLHLEHITAKTEDAEKTFLIENGKPTVTLQHINSDVREDERIRKAQNLANHIPKGVIRKV